MAKQRIFVGVSAFLAGAVCVTAAGWGQTAVSAVPPPSCAQYELLLAAPPSASAAGTSMRLPEYGKPAIEKAPAGGWEPFAYSPTGQLVYRRCAR